MARKLVRFAFALALASLGSAAWAGDGALRPVNLRCEYFPSPSGIDVPRPRLSWEPAAAGPDFRGQRQTAYRLRVASAPDRLNAADLWDSGWVESSSGLLVDYSGLPLRTGQSCFWQVQIRDRDGQASEWSPPASWTMGVLDVADWKAKWIGAEDGQPGTRRGLGYHALEAKSLDETKWVQIDLGQPVRPDRILLHPVHDHDSCPVFGFPVRFKVEASDDPEFGTSELLLDATGRDFQPPATDPVEIAAPAKPARYIRVTALRLWPRRDGIGCFALSEIEAISGGRNLALGRTVQGKDTVEHSGWTSPALTDGYRDPGFSTLLLRKDVTVEKPVARATAFVCGLGQYQFTIDSAKVGDWLITPPWSQYGKTQVYDTYDVTNMLEPGRHALGLRLAGGMYDTYGDTRGAQQLRSSGRPKAIAQVLVEYEDCSTGLLVTDGSWTLAPGPTTYCGVFGGEDYDARLDQPGWDSPGFNASSWRPAVVVSPPEGVLAGATHAGPPIRLIETRTPVRTATPKPNTLVFDLGQNAPYIPHVTVKAPSGTQVRLWPAEILKADGTVDQTTIRAGKRVSYTTRTGEPEQYAPIFWYCGSRYWQAEALDAAGKPTDPAPLITAFKGLLVHSDTRPVGEFECSDDLFNRTYTLIHWAMRSNMHSLITDCPHREKSGWLEQIHLNGPGLMYCFDMMPLFRKTVEDMRDAQLESGMVPTMAPEYFIYEKGFRDSIHWGGAYIYLPAYIRAWYGDTTFIGRHYDPMKRYLDYLGTRAKGRILDTGLGDWDGYGADKRTPVGVSDTAYYYLAARTLAGFAGDLNKPEDQRTLGTLAAQIRDAFNASFLDPATGKVATGSQSCQATALDLGLIPDGSRDAAFRQLLADVEAQAYAVSCGEVGHPSLLRALAAAGRSDLVYRIHHQSERPGYGYQLAKGATTLTEAWDASPISHNHFMLGHIMEWFYADLAGIRPDAAGPAFANITFAPQPVGGITWARARYHSVRGPIATSWRKEGGRFTLSIEVPPGSAATVIIPTSQARSVTESGRPLAAAPRVSPEDPQPGRVVLRVQSGRYEFAAAE